MLLSTIASVFSAFLFAQSAHASLRPSQVVANINIVTQLSANANVSISKLSTATSIRQVRSISVTLVNDFQTIISTLSADIVAMKTTPPFQNGVTQPIVDALRNFVFVHQALLSTVIGKHGIFAQFFLTAPIAAVLRSLETIIDNFAFAMIDLIPTRKGDVQGLQGSLSVSVRGSISTYEQVCFPSLFYPKTMPVCLA